jgi:hypothetical protein
MMALDSMSSWKKWLFIGLGFGAGAALAIALIFGCVVWYSSRPKLWNSRDITATFSTPLYSVDENNFSITNVELEYIIENNTSKDFTLSPEQSFFLEDGGALRRSFTGAYKVSDKCFVPAKNKVKCQIAVSSDFDTTLGVDGFAVFDDVSHYNIIFPKPTSPTPDERKHFISALLKKEEQKTPLQLNKYQQ